MDIGKEEEAQIVEPLEDPFREEPVETPAPAERPEREKVPA